MMRIDRRRALSLAFGATALPLGAAKAEDWWSDRRRRNAYEHWRAEQWRHREAEARHEHRQWSRRDWNDEHERSSWARTQPWYR